MAEKAILLLQSLMAEKAGKLLNSFRCYCLYLKEEKTDYHSESMENTTKKGASHKIKNHILLQHLLLLIQS